MFSYFFLFFLRREKLVIIRFFFFRAEDGIRDPLVTGVQTCALPISLIPANSGTWHLVGDPGTATCRRADRPAELRAEIGALGAAYLGDASLAALAAAGRVQDLGSDKLAATSTAFGWLRVPASFEIF